MPDEIEIYEEEFLSYPDSELNFVCLEHYDMGNSESDEMGKYYTQTSSDEIYHSDIKIPSEPYKSPHKSLSPSYNPYCSSMEEYSCSAVEEEFTNHCKQSNATCGACLTNHSISPPQTDWMLKRMNY